MMTYDPLRQVVVLFGGATQCVSGGCGLYQNDTWLWNGATWTLASPAHRPMPTHLGSMAFDGRSGTAVLYGGYANYGSYSSDTNQMWRWDGTDWQQLVETTPPDRYHAGMVYDESRTRLVLYGGANGGHETWVR